MYVEWCVILRSGEDVVKEVSQYLHCDLMSLYLWLIHDQNDDMASRQYEMLSNKALGYVRRKKVSWSCVVVECGARRERRNCAYIRM